MRGSNTCIRPRHAPGRSWAEMAAESRCKTMYEANTDSAPPPEVKLRSAGIPQETTTTVGGVPMALALRNGNPLRRLGLLPGISTGLTRPEEA